MNTTFEGMLDIFWANYTEPTATPRYQLHFARYRGFRGGAVKSKLIVGAADLEFYLTEVGFTSTDAKSWIQEVQEKHTVSIPNVMMPEAEMASYEVAA